MTLVLLCAMVRVKRRVGTAFVLFFSRKVAAGLPECVAVVDFARLNSRRLKIVEPLEDENKQLEGLG